MKRSIGFMKEPNRYGKHLVNMSLLGLAAGWASAVLSVFRVWGALS